MLDPKPERQLPYKQSNFDYLKRAMASVITGGTARKISGGLRYSMAGKTGTAQVVQIAQGKTYNKYALRVEHRDHAWFIAFAPVEKPKIAIAVILENAGWGAKAAPLARALSDYYLLRVLPNRLDDEVKGARMTANPLLMSETAKQNTANSPYAQLAKQRKQSATQQDKQEHEKQQ